MTTNADCITGRDLVDPAAQRRGKMLVTSLALKAAVMLLTCVFTIDFISKLPTTEACIHSVDPLYWQLTLSYCQLLP